MFIKNTAVKQLALYFYKLLYSVFPRKTYFMRIKSTLFHLLLAFCINTCIEVDAQPVNEQDSLALVDLYKSTNGSAWLFTDNWLSGPVKTWEGIAVTGTRVTEVDLSFNFLDGTIPSSIGNLANLTNLNLSSNQLQGTIPSSIGNLVNLTSLYLANDGLSGTIPASIGNLVNLITLNLGDNQLSGTIPSSIGNLTHLNYLQLGNNQLSGRIPASIGNLTNITTFILNKNKLSGNISSSIGNLARVALLDLGNNQLSGTIPSSIGNLINVEFLYLYNNQLSGTIPSSIGNLKNVFTLILRNNKLSGNIPPSLGNLVNLGTLHLDHNQLSGKIPAELGNLSGIYEMHLNNNQFEGAIPSSFGNLINLFYSLRLDHNQLSGSIPTSLGNLVHLRALNLSHNKLNGKIPSNITNLQFLRRLKLQYNDFTFDGMELVAKTFPFAIYNKEALIPVHQSGKVLSVSAGGTLSHNTYKWFRREKSGVAIVATITGDSVFHPSQSGIYHVEVTNSVATGLTLCSNTIHYVPAPEFASASSENTLQRDDKRNIFTVYPNPVKNMLHIQTNGSASFSLLNQSGQTLLTTYIKGNGNMNVSNMAAGLYYLKNNMSGAVQKIIIAR
jgi:Leucine-rich repeat (LRR) protein